jgi:hypothetical protein
VTAGYVRLSVEDLRAPAQAIADRIETLCGIDEPAGANVARIAR